MTELDAPIRAATGRPPPFDAVLVMGKELRRDGARARRELGARAAAAAAAWRAGARRIYSLEAQLRGQEQSGSRIVAGMLAELGVPPAAIHLETCTCSTREEVVRGAALFQAHGVRRPLVLTASYHVARTAWHFADVGVRVSVQAPTGLWRFASDTERKWIRAGEPDAQAIRDETMVEQALFTAARLLRPLPRGLRSRLEIHAGWGWRRGS